MTKQTELITYLFDGQQHMLSSTLVAWMESSSRFTDFVSTYRDKIRKKIRVTHEPESILDVFTELEVAYGLMNDRRLAVVYEPYASEKRRGPDFSVSYRTNQLFNIEVARIRIEESEGVGIDLTHKEKRILRILLGKLGQMQPGMANLLVIHTSAEVARSIDLDRLMQDIKIKAERKDPFFYSASGYTSPAGFYTDFLHLSGILLWASLPAMHSAPLWVNKQARHGLPDKVLRLISSLPSGVKQIPSS